MSPCIRSYKRPTTLPAYSSSRSLSSSVLNRQLTPPLSIPIFLPSNPPCQLPAVEKGSLYLQTAKPRTQGSPHHQTAKPLTQATAPAPNHGAHADVSSKAIRSSKNNHSLKPLRKIPSLSPNPRTRCSHSNASVLIRRPWTDP